jgi:hypothetical protein
MDTVADHDSYVLSCVSIYHHLHFINEENIFYADLLAVERTTLLLLPTGDVARYAVITPAIKRTPMHCCHLVTGGSFPCVKLSVREGNLTPSSAEIMNEGSSTSSAITRLFKACIGRRRLFGLPYP